MKPLIRIREGVLLRPWGASSVPWRQCEIIDDDSVVIIDMVPALFGWNYGKITRQGHESWCGMTADGILAFKSEDHCARPATDEERACILGWLAKPERSISLDPPGKSR